MVAGDLQPWMVGGLTPECSVGVTSEIEMTGQGRPQTTLGIE